MTLPNMVNTILIFVALKQFERPEPLGLSEDLTTPRSKTQLAKVRMWQEVTLLRVTSINEF